MAKASAKRCCSRVHRVRKTTVILNLFVLVRRCKAGDPCGAVLRVATFIRNIWLGHKCLTWCIRNIKFESMLVGSNLCVPNKHQKWKQRMSSSGWYPRKLLWCRTAVHPQPQTTDRCPCLSNPSPLQKAYGSQRGRNCSSTTRAFHDYSAPATTRSHWRFRYA